MHGRTLGPVPAHYHDVHLACTEDDYHRHISVIYGCILGAFMGAIRGGSKEGGKRRGGIYRATTKILSGTGRSNGGSIKGGQAGVWVARGFWGLL